MFGSSPKKLDVWGEPTLGWVEVESNWGLLHAAIEAHDEMEAQPWNESATFTPWDDSPVINLMLPLDGGDDDGILKFMKFCGIRAFEFRSVDFCYFRSSMADGQWTTLVWPSQ